MADDRHDEASQEGSRPKRSPPTIDLQANEISRAADDAGSEDAGKTADDQPSVGEQPVPPLAASRASSAAISAIAGALAAALVVGSAWLAGWPSLSSAPQVTQAEFGDLSNRVASVESRAGKPAVSAPDPAAAARIDTLEKSVASRTGGSPRSVRQAGCGGEGRDLGAARRRQCTGSFSHQRADRRDRAYSASADRRDSRTQVHPG